MEKELDVFGALDAELRDELTAGLSVDRQVGRQVGSSAVEFSIEIPRQVSRGCVHRLVGMVGVLFIKESPLYQMSLLYEIITGSNYEFVSTNGSVATNGSVSTNDSQLMTLNNDSQQ